MPALLWRIYVCPRWWQAVWSEQWVCNIGVCGLVGQIRHPPTLSTFSRLCVCVKKHKETHTWWWWCASHVYGKTDITTTITASALCGSFSVMKGKRGLAAHSEMGNAPNYIGFESSSSYSYFPCSVRLYLCAVLDFLSIILRLGREQCCKTKYGTMLQARYGIIL